MLSNIAGVIFAVGLFVFFIVKTRRNKKTAEINKIAEAKEIA